MRSIRTFLRNSATAFVAVLLLGSAAPLVAFAAQASPAMYRVTRHTVSVPANHEIQFTTPTGVDGPADTITLSGYGTFGTGAIVAGDVDLFHGPVTGLETSEVVAAAAGIGTWGVSIAGGVITFTAPTNAVAGEIAPGDQIIIRIGTNATGGVNQITNPAAAGLAQISIGGTFGDSNMMGFPIISDDSVGVTATVVASSTPVVLGGGGGGGGDNIPPLISNVQVINITSSTVTIVWTTNESSNSIVDYGLNVSYTGGTVTDAGFVTNHSITLVNLSPATLYHFQVSSRDASANLGTLGDFTFTTLGDLVPPIISNIQVVDITDTSARVIWTTNELADTFVGYGKTALYGLSASDPGFVTAHSMVLTGLTPGTLYHFFARSADQTANTATTPDMTFATLADSTPPANLQNFSAIGGDSVVHLSWQPPVDPDYAGVRIVRSTTGFPTGPFDGTLVYVGSGTATDDTAVVNGVTYYYAAFAFDSNGNYASGALAQATPLAMPKQENTNAACSNGVDDDVDGKLDCADPDCAALAICKPKPPVAENTNATCSNGVDDDLDGAIDCADSGCAALAMCILPVVPVPTPNGQILTISAHFFGAQGTIELVQDPQHQFGAPANSTVVVTVPLVGIQAMPQQAFLVVGGPGGSTYLLSLNAGGTAYTTSFVVPSGSASIPLLVSMTFQGGGAAVSQYTLIVQPGGKVVHQDVFGQTTEPVPGALVSLYVDQNGTWVLWNGAPYGQQNPAQTAGDGSYRFVVPNGRYFVSVEKDGYVPASSSPVQVSNNVFGETVSLIQIPLLPPKVVSPTSTLLENISNLAQNSIQQALFGAALLRKFLNQLGIQRAVQVVGAPALLAISVLNLATAVPFFNLFAYLQFLFTQPLLMLWKRRKRKYGLVYNSLTKQPVDLAIVRLLQSPSRVILQTRVTDRSGRFAFMIKEGAFIIDVVKPGYVFPTLLLKDQKTDVDHLDLYHGHVILADSPEAASVNIPIDPVVPTEPTWQVVLKKVLRRLQTDIAFLSVLLTMIALVVSPSVQIALMLLAQVGIFMLFQRLSVHGRAKQWGIVFDAQTHQPIARAIVRIFDKKFNKLLETQITDTNGKYGFFVRRNVFYVTAEREGYEKYVSPDVDLTTKNEAIVDQNLPLQRKAKV